MSIAAFPVFCRPDVVLVVFAFQNVDGVSKDWISDFLFQAPPTRNDRSSDSALVFLFVIFIAFLQSSGLIILSVERTMQFLDILSYYTISFVALPAIECVAIFL